MGITLERNQPEAYFVLPENEQAVRAFCALQTQWRRDNSGHICGLDYNAVEIVLRAMEIEIKAVFAGLQIMEREVLKEISKNFEI